MAKAILADFTEGEKNSFLQLLIDSGLTRDLIKKNDKEKAGKIVAVLGENKPKPQPQPQPQPQQKAQANKTPVLKFVPSNFATVGQVIEDLKDKSKNITADEVLKSEALKKQEKKCGAVMYFIYLWATAVIDGENVTFEYLFSDGTGWKKSSGGFSLNESWHSNYLSAVMD